MGGIALVIPIGIMAAVLVWAIPARRRYRQALRSPLSQARSAVASAWQRRGRIRRVDHRRGPGAMGHDATIRLGPDEKIEGGTELYSNKTSGRSAEGDIPPAYDLWLLERLVTALGE